MCNELQGCVVRARIASTVADGGVRIEGERQYKKEDKKEKYHRIESFKGKFSRTFALPDNVNIAAIGAENKDGVLTVHVPKTKAETPKAVEVKVS